MKSVVKQLTYNKAVIDFHTRTGLKTLEINRTHQHIKSYEDFSAWDVTDEEYYKIDNICDRIRDEMDNGNEVSYELD
jgi:predicted fused transcriptional regulator/phosphomethylpyrimidine kinase